MPLGERDPLRRLDKIRETTAHLKESKQALGAEVLTQVGEWTPSTLLSLGARMVTRALPFNLVVTNVPGPQLPLYLLGARMLDNYGLIPLIDYLCLGIVLFSYDGKLCWGFTARLGPAARPARLRQRHRGVVPRACSPAGARGPAAGPQSRPLQAPRPLARGRQADRLSHAPH